MRAVLQRPTAISRSTCDEEDDYFLYYYKDNHHEAGSTSHTCKSWRHEAAAPGTGKSSACPSSLASTSSTITDDSTGTDHEIFPQGFFPGVKDIVIGSSPSESRPGSPFTPSIPSVEFEVLLHRSVLPYLKSTPAQRGQIVDKIIQIIAERGGRFVQRESIHWDWIEVSWKAAREFTATELKEAAREVLTSLRARKRQVESSMEDKGDFATSSSSSSYRQQKRGRFSTSIGSREAVAGGNDTTRVLHAKFKRPKRQQNCHQEWICAMSRLEILSQVAESQLSSN